MKNHLKTIFMILVVLMIITLVSVSLTACSQPASVNVEIERI